MLLLVYYTFVDWFAIAIVCLVPLIVIVVSCCLQLNLSKATCVFCTTDGKYREHLMVLIKISKAVFGDFMIDTEERHGKMILLLYNKPFPLWSVLLVATVLVNIVLYITTVFFNLLLIDRRYECTTDIGFDCFHAVDVNSFNYGSTPFNCSELRDRDIPIICYKLTFNFPTAAAFVGGLMEFLPLLFIVPLYIIIKLINERSLLQRILIYIFQWIILLTLITVGLVAFFIIESRVYIMGNDINNLFTYMSLFVILITVLVMPWSLVVRRTDTVVSSELLQNVEKGLNEQTDILVT